MEFDTQDAYQDTTSYLLPGPLPRLTLTVIGILGSSQVGQAVVQFTTTDSTGLRPQANPWNSQEYTLVPGVWTFDKADLGGHNIAAVRARSKVPGTPAHVIVLA